jgi:acyl-CoA synthetase (AMP-forming)/AMP-acid ligase II
MSVVPHATLVDAIRHWAIETPNAIAFRFLTDLGARVDELSFAALDLEARDLAARILDIAKPKDRAVLVFTSESAFVRAFFGCLYAGILPVPASPPPPHRDGGRLAAVVEDCLPSIALTQSSLIEIVRRRIEGKPGAGGLAWLDADHAFGTAPNELTLASPGGGDAALLQYTSGATASPRGVIVTHDNLVANCTAMLVACGIPQRQLHALAWLPLFHDMGLMGHVVLPAYFGATATLLPVYDFLQKPASWLRALSDYRATFSLAPDFAYGLCVDRVSEEQLEGLDLSAWRCAGNGSEPIRCNTMRRFAAKFSRCGFSASSFFPSYGLAESTLLVSAGPVDDPLAEIASSGVVRSDTVVRIVDPETRAALADSAVGEIWVRGPSVASGYWNRPEESLATFDAVCTSDGGRYLRTGDLGFLQNDRLFVCGRLKDVVIIDGKNHHAADLELSVDGCHTALARNGAAIFSVDVGDREVLICACEVRRAAIPALDAASVAASIRGALSEGHGVRLHEAVLLPQGGLPRTTSGKVMRGACRELYLKDLFMRIGGKG